jgi:ribosomal protein L23
MDLEKRSKLMAHTKGTFLFNSDNTKMELSMAMENLFGRMKMYIKEVLKKI